MDLIPWNLYLLLLRIVIIVLINVINGNKNIFTSWTFNESYDAFSKFLVDNCLQI